MPELHFDEAAEAIISIGKKMYARNFVSANDGNISCKIEGNRLLATPTGVSKGEISKEQLVILDMNGNILAGTLQPSTEIKMHLRVYRENFLVKAVVHAHPPVATAYSIAGLELPRECLPETHTGIGTVPVAPFAEPGTEAVAEAVAPYCKLHVALLLQRHGALTWGESLQQAWFRMEALEHHATIMLYVQMIKIQDQFKK